MINYNKLFELENKTVLINGGFGLLGSEITRAFLSMSAKVILIDNNINKKKSFLKTIEKDYIKNLEIIITNTANQSNLEKLMKKFKNNNQIIDTFVNCSYPKDNFWANNNFKNIKHSSLLKNVNLNLTSYIWFSKIIADYMCDLKIDGSIILLSSIYGILAQNTYIYKGTKMSENLTYNFIKGGLLNFSRSMAANYGRKNIRVNCISPGAIAGHVSGKSKKQSSIFVKNYINQNPIKRLGKTEDVASACLFLSSNASAYINGSNLVIDGGWTII